MTRHPPRSAACLERGMPRLRRRGIRRPSDWAKIRPEGRRVLLSTVHIFRKLGWLAGIGLIPGLLSQVRAADFHHTEWNGLGAVFDIKQGPVGFLWLTTSKGVLRFDGVRFRS